MRTRTAATGFAVPSVLGAHDAPGTVADVLGGPDAPEPPAARVLGAPDAARHLEPHALGVPDVADGTTARAA